MAILVLRFAGPAQSWAGYRARFSDVSTFPVPTKSGVAGFLGACLGMDDSSPLIEQFDLRVRVDRTNAVDTDFQVAHPPKPTEVADWCRTAALHAYPAPSPSAVKYATPKQKWNFLSVKMNGQDTGTSIMRRQFIPHAEFICAITPRDDVVGHWLAAVRDPAWITYLGRRGNAPTFPVVFGVWDNEGDVLTALPRVRRVDDPSPARIYDVSGTYAAPLMSDPVVVDVPDATRDQQLDWSKNNLTLCIEERQ